MNIQLIPTNKKVELYVMRDQGTAQYYFDENFKRLDNGRLYYTDFGQSTDTDKINSTIEVFGYCQGDQHIIHSALPQDQLSAMSEHIENLLYSCPLSVMFSIDDESQDFYFDNEYVYDKEQLATAINNAELSDSVKSYLIDQLPEHK